MELFKNTEVSIYNAIYGQLTQISDWDEPQKKLIANIAVAQTKFETANYTSNVYKKYNNVCGYMVYPSSPYQVKNAKGSTVKDGTYAVYASIEDSAKELGDWIKRRKNKFKGVKTTDDYNDVIKSEGYYTTSKAEYSAGLKKYYKVITGGMAGTTPLIIAGIAALCLLFWLR